MADLLGEVERGALSFIATELEAEASAVGAWIASGEAEVVPTLVAIFARIPAIGGIAGSVGNPVVHALEAGIEKYVADLLAKQTPAAIVALVVALLRRLASTR